MSALKYLTYGSGINTAPEPLCPEGHQPVEPPKISVLDQAIENPASPYSLQPRTAGNLRRSFTRLSMP